MEDKITLDHGSGGKMSHELMENVVLPYFANPMLDKLDDGAIFSLQGMRIAFTTDSYTVDPIFFPGGDIGALAVNGTVNDICMCGASPLMMSAALIIEEGFPMDDLKRILESMKESAIVAGVKIVTGDTKVVPHGAADKIFINTSGIGTIPHHIDVSGSNAKPGDKVIVSGTIADHGITILAGREGISLKSDIKSDTAALNYLVKRLFSRSRDVHTLRDPTRGGVGTSLNEIAQKSNVGIRIYEDKLPVKDEVKGACEILGLDPMYIANEGKLIAVVAAKDAEKVLNGLREDKLGVDAEIIGEVVEDNQGKVFMETAIGGTRIVDMLHGEQLPRIC